MLPNAKAKKLLEDYCITNPKKINLEEIANAENLIVEEEELKSHLGRITCGDGYGLIKISSTLESTGAKRFTLAHEMGHYFNEELKKYEDTKPKYFIEECIHTFKFKGIAPTKFLTRKQLLLVALASFN